MPFKSWHSIHISRLLLLRLASSEEFRVLDSLQAFCTRISSLCMAKVSHHCVTHTVCVTVRVCAQFQKDIELEAKVVVRQRDKACKPEDLYGIFLQKVTISAMHTHLTWVHVCSL